jgi:hypothetical protein
MDRSGGGGAQRRRAAAGDHDILLAARRWIGSFRRLGLAEQATASSANMDERSHAGWPSSTCSHGVHPLSSPFFPHVSSSQVSMCSSYGIRQR